MQNWILMKNIQFQAFDADDNWDKMQAYVPLEHN